MPHEQKQILSERSRRPFWQRLLSSILSALIFLLFIEVAAAVLFKTGIVTREGADKHIGFVFDYDLLFYNEPSRTVYHDFNGIRLNRVFTNSYGFRESAEIPDEKSVGEYRILCVGDSSTFGITVDQAQTYPAQLQSILDARSSGGRNYRVINGGCPGFTSFQAVRFMERWVPRLKPDLIIYSLGCNDSALAYKADKDADYHKEAMAWLQSAFCSSNTFSIINRLAILNIQRVGKIKKIQPHAIRVGPLDYESNLKSAVSIARANNSAFIFCPITVVSPYMDIMRKTAGEYPVPLVQTEDSLWRAFAVIYNGADEYHGIKLDYCGEIETCFLNYNEMGELRSATMRTKPCVFDDSIHPNPIGNRAIAEDLARVIP